MRVMFPFKMIPDASNVACERARPVFEGDADADADANADAEDADEKVWV